MSTAPKRKKFEKTEPTTPAETVGARFFCSRCGRAYGRLKGNFPVSHGEIYRGTGYLSVCNDCVDEMYHYYHRILGDGKAAMRRMCMKLDLYWNEAIYDSVERSAGANSRVRRYISQTNLLKYVDKTFDDTINDEDEAARAKAAAAANAPYSSGPDSETESASNPTTTPAVSSEAIAFWGSGFTPAIYEELDARYKNWTKDRNESELDAPTIAIYKQICILETTINRDAQDGKPINNNVNSLNTLLGSANLRPAQKKDEADAELEKMPLGVGIQKWETLRPLPPTPDDQKDVSGLIKNITTWYYGHACKMVGLRNSYCKMYEDAMAKLRVEHPEYEDDDDDTLLADIFGGVSAGEE